MLDHIAASAAVLEEDESPCSATPGPPSSESVDVVDVAIVAAAATVDKDRSVAVEVRFPPFKESTDSLIFTPPSISSESVMTLDRDEVCITLFVKESVIGAAGCEENEDDI